jgi:hypothetical protein
VVRKIKYIIIDAQLIGATMPYKCVKCGGLIEEGEESIWIKHQHYHLNCHYMSYDGELEYQPED